MLLNAVCSSSRLILVIEFTDLETLLARKVNKNNLLGGQILIFLPKNMGK